MALGVVIVVGVALGLVTLATTRVITDRSIARASQELESTRLSLERLIDDRADSAAALTRLITELPIFRAHLTDTQLAADEATVQQMVDRYRQQLGAQFGVVTNRRGAWLASAGWPSGEPVRDLDAGIARALAGESGREIVSIRDRLYLLVFEPALFADEVLGTMVMGFGLDGSVARQLAEATRHEVVLLSGSRVSGSSLPQPALEEVVRAIEDDRSDAAMPPIRIRRLGATRYVEGTFSLTGNPTAAGAHRVVLFEDWGPTQTFIADLNREILWGGLVAFALALSGGMAVSRRISRPLREIAEATTDIAEGNLNREVPLRGGVEATDMAAAFNRMTASLRLAQDQLLHDALHDRLTQLPNRTLLTERLQRALALKVRDPASLFAILFVDLDRFKTVNDSLGHPAGDELLIQTARRLAAELRSGDTVSRLDNGRRPHGTDVTLARLGGDEFMLLVDSLRDPSDAVRIADRVQAILRHPVPIGGQDVVTTASIGIAVSTAAHRSADEVVRDADIAMHRAKAAGGGCTVLFDATMHERAVRRLQLETDLRRAIEGGEFRLYYQPIVSLPERRVAGFEALLRWQHPVGGLLAPGAFMDVALEAGLLTRIDYWVLHEACREARRWQRHPGAGGRPVFVGVNISAPTFGQPDFVEQVEDALAASGLDGASLDLEMTERVAMPEGERAGSILARLESRGVTVSLDDFGTGYSSLSYLQRFPVSTLKIDRSFVRGLHDSDECREIVSTILNLADVLHLDVVAEGAETAEQVAYLEDLGCGSVQGFFFSQPLPASEVETIFAAETILPRRRGRTADRATASMTHVASTGTARRD